MQQTNDLLTLLVSVSILLTFIGAAGTFVIRNTFKRELAEFREELRKEFVLENDLEIRMQLTDERFQRVDARLRELEQRGNST